MKVKNKKNQSNYIKTIFKHKSYENNSNNILKTIKYIKKFKTKQGCKPTLLFISNQNQLFIET
jgi:hypothetical protein